MIALTGLKIFIADIAANSRPSEANGYWGGGGGWS